MDIKKFTAELKTKTVEELQALDASLSKVVGNPYASRDAERRAFTQRNAVRRELAKREAR